jgi:NADH-quinone oxidoreductase subunit K
MISIQHYLMLGAALFTIGVVGVLTRRNIMVILMSIELMMNAREYQSDRLSRAVSDRSRGQVFAIFVITVAAAGSRCRPGHRYRHVQEQGNDEH